MPKSPIKSRRYQDIDWAKVREKMAERKMSSASVRQEFRPGEDLLPYQDPNPCLTFLRAKVRHVPASEAMAAIDGRVLQRIVYSAHKPLDPETVGRILSAPDMALVPVPHTDFQVIGPRFREADGNEANPPEGEC